MPKPETAPAQEATPEPSAGEKVAQAIQDKLGIAVNPNDLQGGKFPLALILGLADRAQKLEEETKLRLDGILRNEARLGQYVQAIAKKLGAEVPPPPGA